jgi:hypothetical protein
MKKTKRNRGGQKGNQNARAHGFYSSSLTPDQTCRPFQISGAITVMFTTRSSLVIFGKFVNFTHDKEEIIVY